jgi:hypothetical protein
MNARANATASFENNQMTIYNGLCKYVNNEAGFLLT